MSLAASTERRAFLVCGDDALALRLVEELTNRYAAQVAVILPSAHHNYSPRISQVPGVRIIESARLDSETLLGAGIADADALALVRQDDVGNIDTALIAQELNPSIRLVLRMFNMSLGHSIRRLFNDCFVLSDAAIAAPAFVAAALGETEPALGEAAPRRFRLLERTVFVARRAELPQRQVLCGVARYSDLEREDETPDLLPADQDQADLVLALADTLSARHPGETSEHRPGRRMGLGAWLRGVLYTLISRKLWLAAVALIVVLVAGTLALALGKEALTPWQAAYLTLLTAVGGSDPDLSLSLYHQLLQTIVTLAGVALVPVVTAAVVEAVVNARLAVALGRLRQPISGHVVVVGLGNVGTRVIRELYEVGVPVVTIDRAENPRGGDLARQLGIPLVVGDASREEVLRAAHVQTCRALVVLSTDDVSNLEAALNGRALNKDLRVILRLFDGDFAARVQQTFDITSSRSVSYLAAPAFAAAMVERSILATIPVGRRVLLIAEVPIGAGSALDGGRIADVKCPGKVWTIALYVRMEPRPRWRPPDEQEICAGDRVLVVATRAGLAEMIERTRARPAVA